MAQLAKNLQTHLRKDRNLGIDNEGTKVSASLMCATELTSAALQFLPPINLLKDRSHNPVIQQDLLFRSAEFGVCATIP